MAALELNAVVPPAEHHEEAGMPKKRLRAAAEPKELDGVHKECPRCGCTNVRFRYYNNKKLNQPRYQCLKCKDFFTHGGKIKPATPAESPESAVHSGERKRKAKEPPQYAHTEKRCPKCSSENTVFKYINNGKQDQPRYKCLDCKGMFQLIVHKKRERPPSVGGVDSAALPPAQPKETTSVESASHNHVRSQSDPSHGAHRMGLYPMGVHPTGVHPTGVHPMGVHPMGVHPMGMHHTRAHHMGFYPIGTHHMGPLHYRNAQSVFLPVQFGQPHIMVEWLRQAAIKSYHNLMPAMENSHG